MFNKLKKKYPNGIFKNLAIVEVDKLEDEIKAKLDELTPQETNEAIVNDAKERLNKITEIVKNKMGGK